MWNSFLLHSYIIASKFLTSRIHNVPVLPPKLTNNTPAFTSGYCLEGNCVLDERVVLPLNVQGTLYHSFRLVIDNNSINSTKVFLDGNLVGAFQEHFAPRLKGGVFVLNKYQSVGLFRNFVLQPCDTFNSQGICIEGNVWIF